MAERVLAVLLLVAVGVSIVGGAQTLARLDWRTTAAFYDLVYWALLWVIGLELARMLVTHELSAVLELLAFVIARKMLKPELTSLDVLLSTVAFVALLAGGKLFLPERVWDAASRETRRGTSESSTAEATTPK
jgi:hypothetical protein